MNYYQEIHILKQEVKRLRAVVVDLNQKRIDEVKKLKEEIINPRCKINEIDAEWAEAMRVVAIIYDVTPDAIVDKVRTQNIMDARHLFCYLCRKHLKMTYLSVGKILNRDHSTIINSVQVYESLIEYDRTSNKLYVEALSLLGLHLHERSKLLNQYSPI
jgi:chromosomal replication initiation ATPase DnaA